ncbi:MAG: hypothetical protein LC733_03765 [Actinobacteria bacterium]|nr:hypothetical protein [Actinomycetota bacterium]
MTRQTVALVAAAFLLLAGCSDSSTDVESSSSTPSEDDLVAEVGSFDLAVGPPTRILVGVFTGDRRFLAFGTVSLRFAYLGTKDSNAPGTFGESTPARFLAIHGTQVPTPAPTEPRVVLPSEGRGVYASVAGFSQPGFYRVEVTAKVAGKEQKATAAFGVNERRAVPFVGEPALPTENLTLTSPDVPKAAVDSRGANGEIPDPELHGTTLAAALAAKRPILAVFATPVYCQSQFCGPVTDMVAGLAHTYGDRASFVHIEIWKDFQGKVVNKAAADWLLRNEGLNEPWVFAIGADGRIAARFDNVATQGELEPWLQQLPVIGPAS